MRLGDKQRLFVRCLVKLWAYGHRLGYEFTLGEAGVINPRKAWVMDSEGVPVKGKREDAEHMRGSLHYKRLAIDVNLFVKGKYIRSSTNPAYIELGEYWERLHALCRWGGRFSDGNHFSIAHGGKA